MDITDIRAGNVKDILSVLRFNDGMTKKDIALATELSFSTVSNMCNALKEKNILVDEKMENATVGRNPNKLFFQYNRFCSICIDLQLKGVLRFAILNFRNDVLFRNPYDISEFDTVEEIVLFARKIYDQILEYPWLEGVSFIGIGVAVSAVFDRETRRVISCVIPTYENAALTDLMEQAFNLPCYVDNEANFCAISIRQKSQSAQNLLYFHISEGTGVGVITQGHVLRGKNGYAAEISHIPLGDPTVKCKTCGSYGCVESDLSLIGLIGNLIEPRPHESIASAWNRLATDINARPLEYTDYLRDKGVKLGAIIAILINLFDPEEVYVGGNIVGVFDLLRPYINDQIKLRCALSLSRDLTIQCDPNSNMAILLGINQSIYEKWNPLNEDDNNHVL